MAALEESLAAVRGEEAEADGKAAKKKAPAEALHVEEVDREEVLGLERSQEDRLAQEDQGARVNARCSARNNPF